MGDLTWSGKRDVQPRYERAEEGGGRGRYALPSNLERKVVPEVRFPLRGPAANTLVDRETPKRKALVANSHAPGVHRELRLHPPPHIRLISTFLQTPRGTHELRSCRFRLVAGWWVVGSSLEMGITTYWLVQVMAPLSHPCWRLFFSFRDGGVDGKSPHDEAGCYGRVI